MPELSLKKQIEIVICYVLGKTYDIIAEEVGASKGAVVNTLSRFRSGTLFGKEFEDIRDYIEELRSLARDMNKKDLDLLCAKVGWIIYERLEQIGVTPDLIDDFSDIIVNIDKGCDAGELIGIYISRWRDIEDLAGIPLENVFKVAENKVEQTKKMNQEIEGLATDKGRLINDVNNLKKEKENLEANISNALNASTVIQELGPKTTIKHINNLGSFLSLYSAEDVDRFAQIDKILREQDLDPKISWKSLLYYDELMKNTRILEKKKQGVVIEAQKARSDIEWYKGLSDTYELGIGLPCNNCGEKYWLSIYTQRTISQMIEEGRVLKWRCYSCNSPNKTTPHYYLQTLGWEVLP